MIGLNPPSGMDRAFSAPSAKPATDEDLKEDIPTFAGPQMLSRAQTFTDSLHDHQPTQVEMDGVLESLRQSAQQLQARVPQHGFFDVEFVGVQHGAMENPLHFLIHDDIYVADVRRMLGTRYSVNPQAILMLFAGWFLSDDRQLRDYGIHDGSQIVVVTKEGVVDEKEQETTFDVGEQPEPISVVTEGPLIDRRLRISKTGSSSFESCRIVRADTKAPRVCLQFDSGGEEWLDLVMEADRFEHHDNPLDWLTQANDSNFGNLAASYLDSCRMFGIPEPLVSSGLAFHFNRVYPDREFSEMQTELMGSELMQKYLKMRRIGIPDDAIIQAMTRDSAPQAMRNMFETERYALTGANAEPITDYAHFEQEFREKMIEQLIQSGDIPRANILADWEIFSAGYTGFQRERTEMEDMITMVADEEEPRYLMPCKHAITTDSLFNLVNFELKEGKTRIKCPYIVPDSGNKCDKSWTWQAIRLILQAPRRIVNDLETKWAFNVVADRLNAQKCDDCGAILFRDEVAGKTAGYKATCSNCRRLARLSGDGDDVPVKHFCWGCRTEWTDPEQMTCGNPHCAAQWAYKVLEVLRNCDGKTIGSVENVPTIRACVVCGQLITHWTACKHMQCYVCKKSFCFVCLLPYRYDGGGWQCGSSGTVCPIAPVQEEQIFAFASRNILNLRHELEDEAVTRNEWTSGAQVEIYDESSNVWLAANIVEISPSDDGNDICDIVLNDDAEKHFRFPRHDVHVRPRVFRTILADEPTKIEREESKEEAPAEMKAMPQALLEGIRGHALAAQTEIQTFLNMETHHVMEIEMELEE